jgi:hypothetical protein
MKLVPASSPGMEAAHKNIYVRTIVDIMLKDRNLLRLTATFLKEYTSDDQEGFEERLEALRLSRSRSDVNGIVTAPKHAITLTQTLQRLYQQKNQSQLNYQRGAIVELLVCKLICDRYNQAHEICLTNQRFVENYKPITVQEVDVAALSIPRQKVEGYECKISPTSFASYDGINLKDLAEAANEKQYRVNVGFVAFTSNSIMKIKLARFQLPACIRLYGLDSIENLQQIPFLDN